MQSVLVSKTEVIISVILSRYENCDSFLWCEYKKSHELKGNGHKPAQLVPFCVLTQGV